MVEYIADSSLLIEIVKANPAAVAFWHSGHKSNLLVHPVCAAEVLVGALNAAQMKTLERALAGRHWVRVTPEDFDHCLAFVKRYHLSHNVGWPDCIIAATALRLDLPVATLNDRHFRVFNGLRVLRPF